MKKAIILSITLAFMGLVCIPTTASAAWWNPFTWKGLQMSTSTSTPITASTTAKTSDGNSLLPTTDDLYKRIAELEMKLDRARADLEKERAITKSSVTSTSTPSSTGGSIVSNGVIASKDIFAKVKPAIVFVDALLGSASGAIIDLQGHIITSSQIMGTSTEANITLSSGVVKKAKLIGIEESNNIAILQLSDKKASSYIPLNYGVSSAVGNTVYVVGFQNNYAIGSAFVPAVISQKTSSSIQVTSDDKPLDNGGALITNKGAFIGIPNASTCKVLEEMKTCLKYTISTNLFPSRIPLLIQGMKLYKDKKNKTPEETLFGGYLDGFYSSVNQSSDMINSTVDSLTGKNSFDYFNSIIADDTEGKIAKLYAFKLRGAAQNMVRTYDSLKSASYALHISLINDNASMANLDQYQQKTIKQVQADNEIWLTNYQNQVDLWTKKKNEYDGFIAHPADMTNDYLMAEGVFMEKSVVSLGKERQKILNSLSSDVMGIF